MIGYWSCQEVPGEHTGSLWFALGRQTSDKYCMMPWIIDTEAGGIHDPAGADRRTCTALHMHIPIYDCLGRIIGILYVDEEMWFSMSVCWFIGKLEEMREWINDQGLKLHPETHYDTPEAQIYHPNFSIVKQSGFSADSVLKFVFIHQERLDPGKHM